MTDWLRALGPRNEAVVSSPGFPCVLYPMLGTGQDHSPEMPTATDQETKYFGFLYSQSTQREQPSNTESV